MKLNRMYAVVAAALVGAGVATAYAAAPAASGTTTSTSTPQHGHWHHFRGSPLVGTLLRATRQLNLTADQQTAIKGILSTARTQNRAAGHTGADVTVLGNPGHPDYGTAIQTAKTQATSRIDREVALQGQIYDVLTTEQKQQLPTVLAAMKAKFQQHKSAWQQGHGAGAVSGG